MTTPPSGPAEARGDASLRKTLSAFALDVVLAIALSFTTMMLGVFAWSAWRGVQLARQGGDLDPAQFQAAVGTPPVLFLIILTLVSTGGTALVLYAWRRRATALEQATSWASARRPRTWLLILLAGVTTFFLSSVMTWAGRALGLDLTPSNLEMIEAGFARYPVFLALFAVLLAPLYEELLFRRVLFGRLWQAGWPVVGLLLSSVIFALVHEMPGLNGKPVTATLFLITVYAGMGAIFAAVYRATGTLWAPIGAHILNNGLALAVLQVYGGGQG